MTPLLEALVPAVLGGLDGPVVIGWVIVAAMVVAIGFVVFLALGPGTQPYQAEHAEPTSTDDSGVRDANAEEQSNSSTESGSD
ncbi:hypothetical protein CP556_15950 [Natrinema sp. CBA1119]|uniref:hypothetical protein n=1 Tax=Natrinema sp. CBA1119 TaxID=1608465 RepID=UPI000BF6204F|nr:hypothetical protein [Natrinema sp. CBA1119]PGF17445.1 hypothetical protein CP556_15950 [Natrinema sp. CBA1119]